MDLQTVIDAMMTPEKVQPLEIRNYYMFLTSLYATHSITLCDALAISAGQEAILVTEGTTSSKAKQIVRGSENGQTVIKLTGLLNAIEELIRSLKTAQKCHAEAGRNTF